MAEYIRQTRQGLTPLLVGTRSTASVTLSTGGAIDLSPAGAPSNARRGLGVLSVFPVLVRALANREWDAVERVPTRAGANARFAALYRRNPPRGQPTGITDSLYLARSRKSCKGHCINN